MRFPHGKTLESRRDELPNRHWETTKPIDEIGRDKRGGKRIGSIAVTIQHLFQFFNFTRAYPFTH